MSTRAIRLRVPRGAAAIWVPWAGLAGAGVVVIAGLWIHFTAGGLGALLPPFVMQWRPRVQPLLAVSVIVLGGGAWVAPTLVARVRSPLVFAALLYLLALALGLGLNLARVGALGLWRVFDTGPHGSFESHFEYLPALGALSRGVGYYLHHFAALLPYTTTHVKGNPPGPLIALHLLGIGGAKEMAALCVGVGALTAPLAYDLGRTLGDERRGRLAGVLSAFAPSILLFGVTSADYAFATLGLIVACLLVRPGMTAIAAGSIVAAIASFFSWLLLAIPAWAALVAWRRSGGRRLVVVCCGVGLALVSFNGLLALLYGYDPFSALRATAGFYRHGLAAQRPYSFWLFGSPAAWTLTLGLPIAWLALRALSEGDTVALATWAIVVVASVLGFTKAETERIWLPFVPLACVGGGAALSGLRLRAVLGALVVQALATELLFFTIW